MAFIGMLDKGDKTKAADVIKEATKLRGSKGFDDKAYGYVLQEAAKLFDREKKGYSGIDTATQNVINSAKAIEFFVKAGGFGPGGQLLNKLLGSYLEQVQNGKDPKQVEESIVKNQTDEELNNYNKTPKIRVKRISDGRTGNILEKDFNKSIYEKL
jgi:hypothetical protein